MQLRKLLDKVKYEKLINFKDKEITGISYNSKTTKEGDIFICLVGEHVDGHDFAQMAIDKGAKALLVEKELKIDIPQILVESTRFEIANISDTFFDYPSQRLDLIGVTGTNGKTTVTHLIQKIIERQGEQCAVIGTLGYKLSSLDKEYKDAKHTTPQAPELQSTLGYISNQMKIKHVVMEVSSHALEQNRVGGCDFDGAVLTNLTQDHLDYHITMDNYFDSKAILFKKLKKGAFAVINADDKYAAKFIEIVPEGVKIITYGINTPADIKAENIGFSPLGAEFECIFDNEKANVKLTMNGLFSIYNVLAALAVAKAKNFDIRSSIKTLEATKGVAGRFEIVVKSPTVIVDYAHTPDGLENVLKAAKEITPKKGELICIVGCGGDRDATKRPQMGAIAERIADKIIITSDNPRSEDPQQIITDILAGLKSVNSEKVFVELDRRKAIELLAKISQKHDVAVVAGKGHEDYQILKDKTIRFDDKEEVENAFRYKD